MTRKDYEAIAAAFKAQLGQDATARHAAFFVSRREALAGVVNRLLTYFRASNEAFDAKRFIEACGLEVVDGVIYDERFALVA